MTDVFISYSRSDRKRVRLIALGLAAEGFSVWWDPDIKPGAKWNDAIRKSLDNAAAVITCWSPDSVKSSWVVAETTHASNKNNLVPCTVRACHPPIPFNMIQSADLSHWKGDADDPDWMLLLRQVRRLVEAKRRPVAAAPPPGEAEARSYEPAHPVRYERSHTRGRLGPRLSQLALMTVVVGAVLTAGLWATEQRFTPRPTPTTSSQPAPTPPAEAVPDPIIETSAPEPREAPAAQSQPAPAAPAPVPIDAVSQSASEPEAPAAATNQAPKSPLVIPADNATTPPAEPRNRFGEFLAALLSQWAQQRNEQQEQQSAESARVITGDTQSALSREVDGCLSQMARACTYYPPDGYPNDFAADGRISSSEQRLLSTRGFPEPGLPSQANLNYCRSALEQGQGVAGQRIATPLVSACSQVHTPREPVIR